MPYEISWKDKGIIWTFYGVVTAVETRQASLDILGDPRFVDLHYQIVDISTVEQFNLTSEDMDEAGALDEAATLSNLRIIVAVVAASDDAMKIAKMYKSAMRQAKWPVEIFRTMDDATEWIRSTC